MILCSCGKQFDGETMFRDALAHWHTEHDKELERRIVRARREVNHQAYLKNRVYQQAWHARQRAVRRQAAMQGAAA